MTAKTLPNLWVLIGERFGRGENFHAQISPPAILDGGMKLYTPAETVREKLLSMFADFGPLKQEKVGEEWRPIAHELPNGDSKHGTCCTCRECRHYHDDCVCQHNEIIRELSKLFG